MLQKSSDYPSRVLLGDQLLVLILRYKDINLFCNICNCNRTECKPLPIFMNSSNSKYTWMIPPFHNRFQSKMVYIIWEWVSILWFRWVQTSYYTGTEIIQAVCYFLFVSYKFIVINKSYFSEEIVLLETSGLTIVQKDLLSINLFINNDEKYYFLAFRRSDTHLFLCFWNKRLFSSLLCFRKRFLILLRIIIALEISALMNVYDQHASIVVSVMRAYWKLHNR